MEKSQRNNQRTKRNVIISALLAILLCIGIIVGATFALFTSEDKVNVSVTSGNVEITAVASDLWLYSPKAISTEDYTVSDDENVATTNEDKTSGAFVNGGTAKLVEDEDTGYYSLALDKMTPGDKVTFKLVLTNHSNVSTKYRTKVVVSDDTGLFAGLSVNIGGITAQAASIWKNLPAAAEGGTVIATYECSVELPTTADNTYKNTSCKIAYLVEQVQANAATTDDNAVVAATATASVTANESALVEDAVTLTSVDTLTVNDNTYPVAKATVPATAKLTSSDVSSLTLNVYETATPANFTIASSESYSTKTLEVEIDGVSSVNDQVIVVSAFVGTGMNGFALYHNNDSMTSVDSATDVDANGEYYYNSTTGIVTFATTSFSPFTVVHTSVARIGTRYYETLAAAIAALDSQSTVVETGALTKIVMTKDVTIATPLVIKKKVKLDLGGYTLTTASTIDAVWASGADAYVLVDNGKIVSTRNGLCAESGATLVANDKLTVVAQECCFFPQYAATIMINGGEYTSNDNGVIMTSGATGLGGNTIIVNGGTFNGNIKTKGYIAVGICVANDDTVTINAGTFNIVNGVGVIARDGKTIVNEDVVLNITINGTIKEGKVGDATINIEVPQALVLDKRSGYGDPTLENNTTYTLYTLNKE